MESLTESKYRFLANKVSRSVDDVKLEHKQFLRHYPQGIIDKDHLTRTFSAVLPHSFSESFRKENQISTIIDKKKCVFFSDVVISNFGNKNNCITFEELILGQIFILFLKMYFKVNHSAGHKI